MKRNLVIEHIEIFADDALWGLEALDTRFKDAGDTGAW